MDRIAVFFKLFCCCFSLLMLLFLPSPHAKVQGGDITVNTTLPAGQVPADVIRFHVRAHSNDTQEQQIKNEVAASIISEYTSSWRQCGSREELYQLLLDTQAGVAATAQRVLNEHGVVRDVEVELARNYFPARLYGGEYYPPGEYEALWVVIGSGKGENWWCVLFPPLCFGVVPAPIFSEKNENPVDGDRENDFLQEEEGSSKDLPAGTKKQGNEDEENEDTKWRFWIVDCFIRGVGNK